MAHMQQQVLDAVVAVLQGADTRAVNRVFADRLDNLTKDLLPAILVEESEEGETIDNVTIGDVQRRALPVRIKCVLPLSEKHATECREFGLEVEKAMQSTAARAALVAICKGGYSITASRLDQSTEGEQTFAQRVQDWTFTYLTRRGAPDAKA